VALRRSAWSGLAIAWAGLVWVLLTLPPPPGLPSLMSPLPPLLHALADKATHAVLFLVQTLLLHRALRTVPRAGLAAPSLVTALLLALAFGALTEMRQLEVPGRDGSLGDLLADGAGGLAYAASSLGRGLGLAAALRRRGR
jgi:VanZ family protein